MRIGFYLILVPFMIGFAPPGLAEILSDPKTAWDVLLNIDSEAAQALNSTERRLLQAISAPQAAAFIQGRDPASVKLPNGRTLGDLLELLTSSDISWWTADGGREPQRGRQATGYRHHRAERWPAGDFARWCMSSQLE